MASGSGTLKQFFAAFTAGMPALLFGLVMSWPSYTLKVFADKESSPLSTPLSPTHESLIGSLPPMGALVGSLMGGLILDRLGRRNGALFIGILFTLSWCCVLVAWNHWLVMAARIVSGYGGGAAMVMIPVFISETAEDKWRGTLASSSVWMYCVGVMVSYGLGWLFSYRLIIYANLMLCVFNIALVLMLKETPIHLLKNNLSVAALESLAFYRGLPVNDKEVLTEMSYLRAQLHAPEEMLPVPVTGGVGAAEPEKEPLQENIHIPTRTAPVTGWRYLCRDAGSRRALGLCGLLIGLQTWMGSLAVQVYAGPLFARAAPDLSPDLCSVLLAAVMILGSVTSGILIDRAGRKTLQLTCCVLVSACLLALGSLLHFSWAPLSLVPFVIFLYCFVFCVGPGTVPFILLAEVFVPEVQSLCTTLAMNVMWLMNFLLLGLFPLLAEALGVHGVFYVFAGAAAAAALLVILFMPETKGLSARQIQRLLAPPTEDYIEANPI